ncbi:MAG: isoprenylcysteine carboxylmethyltransferase family protein [Planctomycetes bacterium]|nr:isoprenylcysteine carboxylmethyltransferase family protein [Planctomycetota bacterium]
MARSFVRKQRILMSRLFIVGIIALILISKSRWEDSLWGPVFFLAGAILIGIAVTGRLWCSLYISGYKSNTLITTGPYSVSRNPLYFFSFLGAIGIGLATETLTVPVCIAVVFAMYYPLVITSEQKKLAGIHGKAFSDYCKKVPAFFPSFKLLTEPDEYVVKPKIFRKTLFEVMWFVLLIGVIELKEGLEQANLLPTMLNLY